MRCFSFIVVITFLFSCGKEKGNSIPSSKGVYISNEGNFNFGNGEISFYDPNSKQVTNNLFSLANGFSLGDVVQSMYVKDSIGMIVVNNSQKIQLVKIPSFQNLGSISIPGASPRYVLPVNDSIAYVSEIYGNKIHVINYRIGVLVTQIPVPQYTEHLIQVDEFVFAEGKRIIANSSSKGALLKINVATNTYIDKVEFNGDAGGIVKDKNNHIWIAVDEDTILSTNASLKCFDKNFALLENYFLSTGYHPRSLSIDKEGEDLYFISQDVYKCSNAVLSVSPKLFIERSGRNFYSMGVDPANEDIYLSDALDFVQASVIFVYDRNAQPNHTFTAGIISGDFGFNHE